MQRDDLPPTYAFGSANRLIEQHAAEQEDWRPIADINTHLSLQLTYLILTRRHLVFIQALQRSRHGLTAIGQSGPAPNYYHNQAHLLLSLWACLKNRPNIANGTLLRRVLRAILREPPSNKRASMRKPNDTS